MWLTRSKASHAGVAYYDETLEHPMVMHATATGFNVVPLVYFLRHSDVVAYYHPKDEATMLSALRQMSLKLGAFYDYTGVVGFLWVIILGWFRVKRRNPLRNTSKMFCSEMVARLLKLMPVGFPGDPETTSPEDLLEWLSASPAFERVSSL